MGQVLNGTNPGDIPLYQITRPELALNLKTAKSLGIAKGTNVSHRNRRSQKCSG